MSVSTATESEVFSHKQLNQLAKIVGLDNVEGVLAGTLIVELKPVKRWHEEGGVIYFHETFMSDGTTGPDWIKRQEKKGRRVGSYAKSVLLSKRDPKNPEKPYFSPTTGVIYPPVAIRGTFWKKDSERLTRNIRVEADKRGWLKAHAELACLLREAFSDEELEEMGLWYLVAMHDPIEDSDGDPSLLNAYRSDGGRWLHAFFDRPDGKWYDRGAFVFVLPQVSS